MHCWNNWNSCWNKRIQDKHGSNNSAYKTFDKLTILNNPNNVEEYIIKGDIKNDYFSLVFIVDGIIFTIIGIIKKFNLVQIV